MELIKEFSRASNGVFCVIRTRTYAHSMTYFTALVKAAKVDFPSLTDEKIIIRHYGGERFKRMSGIEFAVPQCCVVPEAYTEAPMIPTL